MAEPAKLAAFEGIAAGRLRNKFNRDRLSLRNRPAILRRGELQALAPFRVTAIGIDVDLEAVLVIERRNAQLHLRSFFHVDFRRRVTVFLCGDVDYLDILIGRLLRAVLRV